MKAAFLTGVRQFEVRSIPAPEPPEDGLVMEVRACGVCGSDLRRWREGLSPSVPPMIPGHEIAGQVRSVGRHVKEYKEGDLLAVAPDVHCGRCYYCHHGQFNLCDDLRLIGITLGYPGGFSEQMVLTAEILTNGVVHPFQAGLPFPHAALSEPLSSVLGLHRRIGTGLADTILVMGAGPIGCMHLAVAKMCGARVILSEPSPLRRKMAEPFQPDAILDPSNDDVVGEVRALTGGRGADAVICANPVAAAQAQAVESVRKAGKVVLFGGLPKANPMTALDANRIHYGEICVVGSFSYQPSSHELALQVVQNHEFPADRIITHAYSLDEIGQAFETANGGEALKVIVTMGGTPVEA